MKTDPPTSAHERIAAASAGGKGPPSWLGKRIGQFKLLELLGQGSMGRVFRAEDVRLQRHVALKCLSRKNADPNKPGYGIEQFVREARSEATLEHPNVVQVFEINEHGGVLYIAMELLEGGNLHAIVKASGPMDWVRACQLCAEAADALAYAHKLGIVHRDVKPSNLMLTRGGRCKLTDFGLASVDDPNDSFRLPTEAVGTPQFMAPELGKGKAATPKSDIYSLGATLWFLLTGKAPFLAPTALELLKMHLQAPLPDLRAVRPDVPESLAKAIETAMAKDPAQRFPDAEHFAKVLRVHAIPVGGSGMPGTVLPGSSVIADSGSQLQQQLSQQLSAISAEQRRMNWRAIGIGAVVAACIAGAVSAAAFLLRSGGSKSKVLAASVVPAHPATQPQTASAISRAATTAPGVSRLASPITAGRVIQATDQAALMRLATDKDPTASQSKVSVEGTVDSAQLSRSGKVFRLEFAGADRDAGFYCAYFPRDDMFERMQSKFGGENGAGLQSKKVRVTGVVSLFDNRRPQIVVNSPDQVELVK